MVNITANTGKRGLLNEQPFPTKSPVVAPRTVVAYHGCSMETAEVILTENRFLLSTNVYDWLGEGIYFWEYAPYRALDWAQAICRKSGGEPAVLGATIRLGRCLNLLDTASTTDLLVTYTALQFNYGDASLPANTASGAHFLDREIVDFHCERVAVRTSKSYQTVRGCYPEGMPAYRGSKILTLAHTQIAVRYAACISGVHLVQWPVNDT